MYCHQCGARAHGAYCSHCGAKLIVAESDPESPPGSWADEIRYELLLRRPEVRELMTRHASQSRTRMSGEDFLELCDKALAPVTGVSLARISAMVQPVYASLGIRTGQVRRELFSESAGRMLVAAMCSLARHGQPLEEVEQGQDGCLLRAHLPSDMWSAAGELLITVERREQGTSVEAATVIKGQLYDWGKSKRILGRLFDDLKALPV